MKEPRIRTRYVCELCKHVHAKFWGWCQNCGAKNSLQEDVYDSNAPPATSHDAPIDISAVQQVERVRSCWDEFDAVCGGGLVKGSVVLLGGEPGIGKSTLLTQLCGKVQSTTKKQVIYFSGEESAAQIQTRAHRLGINNFKLLSTGTVSTIAATIKREQPALAVIDSVQTLRDQEGSIEQFAMTLIQIAKQTDCALILVGHVTKTGILAGPKLLEHMVDVVLSFDGDQEVRALRSSKNRFGSTDEVGLFRMTDTGLEGILDPSAYLCNFRSTPTLGSVIFPSREGMRYVLMEIQALVMPSRTQVPTRSVVGWCRNRLSIILGVLEKYTKLPLSFKDVYLNIVGGMRTTDTATADLAVALAIWSSAKDIPIPPNVAAFGEITLSGDIRSTASSKDRIKLCNKYKVDNIVSHDSVQQIQALYNVMRQLELGV